MKENTKETYKVGATIRVREGFKLVDLGIVDQKMEEMTFTVTGYFMGWYDVKEVPYSFKHEYMEEVEPSQNETKDDKKVMNVDALIYYWRLMSNEDKEKFMSTILDDIIAEMREEE